MDAHAPPLLIEAQLPYTFAMPGAGRKLEAELATLCQLMGTEEDRMSA